MPILLPHERIGTTLAGRYRIDSILGRGGVGVVFSAEDIETSHPVAVKVLLPEFGEEEDSKRRFLREARTMAAVHHPSVVEVIDFGEAEDGSLFLALERLEGETLDARLEREGRLDAEATLTVLLPILDGLSAVHEAGFIHRDIKPANLFVSVDARQRLAPKLLDFGLAKVLLGDTGSLYTRTGSMVGTARYMSPEQVRGERTIDATADIWSLGVVAYECLTGEPPFRGKAVHVLLMQVLAHSPPPICDLAPECPPSVASVVERCLAKEPSERPATSQALAAGLRAAMAGGPSS